MDNVEITAVVLAAGKSTRMGVPKMTLPWGSSTVLGTVLRSLQQAGLRRIRVVIGANRDEVEKKLDGIPFTVERVFNPDYENGEMMDSLRVGIRNMDPNSQAVLVVLGDQPQIEPRIVVEMIELYRQTGAHLIVPSYQMRRGHPWLIARSKFTELAGIPAGETMRDFLNRHSSEIIYMRVSTGSVLQDLDTPEDYRAARKDNRNEG